MAKKPTSKRSPIEAFLALSDVEKDRIAASFDRNIPLSETRPLTAAERKSWAAAKRGRGRPRRGKGSKPISVTIELGLLERVDRYVAANGTTRADVIAKALEQVIAGG